MLIKTLVNELRGLIASKDGDALRRFFVIGNPGLNAEVLSHLDVAEIVEILRYIEPLYGAELFAHLPAEQQRIVVDSLSRRRLILLVAAMPHDDRVDLLKRMPEEEREAILPGLAQAERDDILKLSSYAEGTAGSIMTSEYVALSAHMTVAEAIAKLRAEAPDAETIYYAYVVDENRRLRGLVSLKDLILAPSHKKVEAIMNADVIFARAGEDQEEAVRKIAKYDLLALPVINGNEALVGIITHDDAIDVAHEEATEDFHKSGTVGKIEGSLKTAGTWLLYRKRVFWLVVLVFGNIFSGAGIAYFEDTIASYVALVFFLPLLIDSGGNAGSQAATLMVRALATGEVVMRDWVKMLGREVLVAACLGLTMAVAVSGIGLFRGGPEIALVVASTMVVVVIVGSLIGMSLPFALTKLKFDPATASAPLITSIADAAGVIIYFSIATAILPGLA